MNEYVIVFRKAKGGENSVAFVRAEDPLAAWSEIYKKYPLADRIGYTHEVTDADYKEIYL